MAETVPQERGYQYTMYGFGSAPTRYEWNDLPREVLGEGIVINVSHNSSTMIITFNSVEVYAGDYVEIERSEERRVGTEWRWTGDWSSDVCSSDLDGRNGATRKRLSVHDVWIRECAHAVRMERPAA